MRGNLCTDGAILRHKTGENSSGNTVAEYRLSNVRLEEKNTVRRTAEGRPAEDTFALYFVMGSSVARNEKGETVQYVSSSLWDSLPATEKTHYFTVRTGDRIFPLLSVGDCMKMGLNQILGSLGFYTVNTVIPVKDGSGIHHLEVTGRGRIID